MKKEPIAIVGYGCCLPEAADPEAFWKNILESHNSVRDLPNSRWNKSLYVKKDSSHEDRIYAHHAAFVEEEILDKTATELKVSRKEASRLSLLTLAAAHQALKGLPEALRKKNWMAILGCMGQDESVWHPRLHRAINALNDLGNEADNTKLETFFAEQSKSLEVEASALPTSVFSLLRRTEKINGEMFLVDAACASSLAAIDVAIQKLRLGKADFVLSGGIESQLGPESFATFCSADLIAEDACFPLSEKTEGLNQGEGAVVFALTRLSLAKELGLPVYGVIRSCEGTSNGKAASLFSPTKEGQALALEKAYADLDPKALVYLECHATGTRVGDTTELDAVESFLAHHDTKIPVGSVKSLIGHTKGAAGAAGLLKALLLLKHKTLPASPYLEKFIGSSSREHVLANLASTTLPKRSQGARLIGVSSAGFGGTNYHLALEEATSTGGEKPTQISPPKIVGIAQTEIPYANTRSYLENFTFRIPPKTLSSVDDAQLAALMIVEETLSQLLGKEAPFAKERISVISASATGLDLSVALSNRLRCNELLALDLSKKAKETITALKASFAEITEDTGAGILNNVIAGRIANQFDFHGKNFSLDAEDHSIQTALHVAQEELQAGASDLVVVVGCEESFELGWAQAERNRLSCWILTTESLAKLHSIPIRCELNAGKLLPRPSIVQTETGWAFAGQGANSPKMYRESMHHSEFRNYFQKADALATDLGLPPVSWYCSSPEKLTESDRDAVQILALYTAQCASAARLRNLQGEPGLISSHSFGEYAAWVAAGALSFEEMFEVVAYREKIAPPKNERGFLVAVGAEPEKISEALTGYSIQFATYNSPRQTVIAVAPADLEQVSKKLKAAKLKNLTLGTPQPYHSTYLADVAERMTSYLQNRKWHLTPTTIPVVSSVDNKYFAAGQIDKEAFVASLCGQLLHPVLFVEQVRQAERLGISRFIEIGPKPVLTSFIPLCSTTGNLKAEFFGEKGRRVSAQTTNTVESPWFQKVSSAIAKITGYKIDEIHLEDRFQDDLGIDSLMKTEILLTVLKEAGQETSQGVDFTRFREVKDLVSYLQEDPKSRASTQSRTFEFKRMERVWHKAPLAQLPYSANLSGSESETVWDLRNLNPLDFHPSKVEAALTRVSNSSHETLQVLLPSSELGKAFFNGEAQAIAGLGSLLENLGKTWHKLLENKSCKYIQWIGFSEAGPLEEGLIALAKSLQKEAPGIQNQFIFSDSPISKEKLRDLCTKEKLSGDFVCRYMGNEREVPLLEPRLNTSTKLAEGSVVLAIGGARGITRSLVEALTRETKCHLYLCGRSLARQTLPLLKELSAHCLSLHYESLDATRFSELKPWIEKISRKHSRIDLLLNGAGIERSRPLRYKSSSEIQEELCSKLLPTIHLTKLSQLFPIKQFHSFSSVVSWSGNEGQTIYSFANAALSRLAETSGMKAAAIHWPPWDGVGMTEKPMVRMSLQHKGVGLLASDKAWELYSQDLVYSASSIYYSDEFDFWAYDLPWQNLGRFTPILGTRVSESQIPLFQKSFHLEQDTYLKDHCIGGKPVVPGAFGISAFLAAGYLRYGQFPTLRNVKFQSPIVVDEKGTNVFMEILPAKEGFQATLRTSLPAFTAEVLRPLRSSIEFSESFGTAERQIAPATLYAPGGLFHGPLFQCFSHVEVFSQQKARAKLKGRELPALQSGTAWERIIQWIDAAFQLVAVAAYPDAMKLLLPVHVGELNIGNGFYGEFTDLEVVIPKLSLNQEGAIADILIVNAKGQVLISLKATELRQLKAALSPQRAA